MNNRLLIVGLLVVAGGLVVAKVMSSGNAMPQAIAPRVDPLARARDGQTDASPRLPIVRDATERPSRTRTVPPPAPTPIESSTAGRSRAIVEAPPPPAPDTAKGAKLPKQQKTKTLEREALAYVGTDPMAEAIWVDAINDPTISAHDRSDLIEDLNEDGFADPKHLTPDDLPLIESRLALIEQHAPLAMDDVNAAAFAEAYKDLVNMYAKAMNQ